MPREEKEERRKAKEQDKNYVEYRKLQILREIKPTTKAFDMKKFDESFPRERRTVRHSEMEFGELMHKYLTLRPDGRFATWQGKPKKRAKSAAAQIESVLKKTPSKIAKDVSKRGVKNYQKALQNNLKMQDEGDEDDVDQKRVKEALEYMPKEDVEAKNKYLLNAIVENKPFWLIGDPLVPENGEDEEDYVDAKMLMDFMNKKISMKGNPVDRKQFFVWGPTPQLWNELKQFTDKKLVIGNTLESIVASSESKAEKKRVDSSTESQLKWDSKTKAIDFVMDSCPIEKTALYEGKLENIVRGRAV